MTRFKILGLMTLLSVLLASSVMAWQWAVPQTGPGANLAKGQVIASVDANTITGTLAGTAALDFISVAATLCSGDLTMTVTGASLNDVVLLGVPNGSVNAGSQFTAWVSAANTVSVRHCNISAAPNDPASGTFIVQVVRQS